MLTEERKKLRDNILSQAKYFLEEFKEFYPFGSVIMSNGELRPFSVSDKEENPKSNEVIESIEKAFYEGIRLKKYTAVAMGVDVLFTVPESNEKTNAIEVRMDSETEGAINFYIPYRWEDEEVKFIEMYADTGTLNLYH